MIGMRLWAWYSLLAAALVATVRAAADSGDAGDQLPVSTGRLPPAFRVRELVQDAYERYKSEDQGHNADHYPALARVPRELFGICLVGIDGAVYEAGDTAYHHTIMSVAKPFVFALVCEVLGPQQARALLGVNSTGLPFNSVTAIELNAEGKTNPMVNSGAIAATSLVPGATAEFEVALHSRGFVALRRS